MSVSTLQPSSARSRLNTSVQRTRSSRSGVILSVALCTATGITPVFADDTEIFFGQADPTLNTSPNVLFVLDTSGSMNWSDSGYTGTRLERMKDALTFILDSSSNINVGLMRFNGYNSGGAVIYPMTPIDQAICIDNNCGSINQTVRVSENNDDMEQFVDSGVMTPNGVRLSLGNESGNDQLVGLRFQGIDIPTGATITSAHIEFTSRDNNSEDTDLIIAGHDTADAPSISTTDYYLRDIDKTDATVNWSPSDWTVGDVFRTPDLKDVVEEITSRADWCGGQSMGFVFSGTGRRDAYAYNGGNASRSAVLRVTYDSTSIPSDQGCATKVAVAQVKESISDTFERTHNGRTLSNWRQIRMPQLRWGNNRYVVNRLHFEDLAIPQGATIEDATIIFNVFQQRSGAVALKIDAENHDDAPFFVSDNQWITDQPLVAGGGVPWNIANSDNWAVGANVFTPDISSIVQSVVNRSGWESNNSMAFQFKIGPGHIHNNFRSFTSFDHDRARAPKLRVVYRTNIAATNASQTAFKSARDDMKQVVNELSATGGTPVVAAYLEAANYMLGGPVEYGKERGYSWNKHRYHRVSHPDSYTGGTVTRDSNCSDSNIESNSCKSEKITGNPTYISPLDHSCQTSHIVFLSDGAATSNTAINKVKALTGVSECKVTSGGDACGAELAEWLEATDHNLLASRKQNISTYTIGFNNSSNLLESMATAGGGEYKDANSSAELVTVFEDILGDVLAVDTSFVGPGATVNQFNRLTHRNDIYYAVFKPNAKPTWQGNLKRYQAEVNEDGVVEIRDRDGDNVLDETTGFFAEDAKSFWGTATDGNSVEKGGAADKISLTGPGGQGTRNVYTFTGAIPVNGADLSTSDDYALHEDNNEITEANLGITTGNANERAQKRKDLLQWARGLDVEDEDLDGSITDVRTHIGDPMHAKPVILNYKAGSGTDTTIFMSTNEGMLHAVEHENGTELFSFMPEELLPNLDKFYKNQQSTRHPYGLDGDLTIWHEDLNGNVMVDDNEKAYLFVGMRRGGSLYYGFDVSKRTAPKLMWKIEGGQGSFQNLGQTWSRPVATQIMRQSTKRTVLIFGGGYDSDSNDPNPDNLVATRTAEGNQPSDNIGNALYIVDAETGSLIWSAQSDDSGSKKFTDMQYSIPADVRTLDVNSDGLTDQLYFGDMGGQVWRFDFTPYHSGGELLDGGVIARLNGDGIENSRRFYNQPDVALIAHEGTQFLSVSIGSGWRAHPLHNAVEDRFYMIKQSSIYRKPDGYGKNAGTVANPDYTPVTESDLVDISDNLTPTVNEHGWMLKMEGEGEKVLGASLTVNNQLIFTTYEPVDAADPCSPAIGGGYAYVVNVLNGAPTVDLQDDSADEEGESDGTDSTTSGGQSINVRGKNLNKGDRNKKLNHGGIPPAPTLLIVESKNNQGVSTYGVDTRVNLESLPTDIDNLTQRTYWQDRGRGNRTPAEIAKAAKGEDSDSDVAENEN
ncbi:MAG: PilC/PilY family type IV pilus protein [Granulosicoccus sp.]